jgi:membrane fusion protein, copper/silver efflux system
MQASWCRAGPLSYISQAAPPPRAPALLGAVMKRARLVILIVLIAAVSFFAGSRLREKSPPQGTSSQGRRILYYVDPMHPAHKSDKPGIAPDCGMQLEPVYADGVADVAMRHPVGTVNIAAERQQLIGVRVAAVESNAASHEVRLLGRVAADERRVYFLNAATDGWVQETFSNTTGSLVKKDEVLATCYAPEFQGAEQAYFYALHALDRFTASGKEGSDQTAITKISVKQAADGLRNLGMGDVQIQTLARDRQYTENIEIRSPATGFVLERNVSAGLRFERGKQLYRIADLSHIWILADAFENEAQYFRPGTRALVRLPHQQKNFVASVSDVPPQFDPATRTLKIRLEGENPGLVLRPHMFVDVVLPIKMLPGMSVPSDAIVDSGLHKRVFVDRGNGYFEPREIKTGWLQGDRVQVVKGLMPGERIVVSGTFLVDSESRMEAAAAGMYSAAVKDPVCAMEIDQPRAVFAGRQSEYEGKTFYFCSDECKRRFDRTPAPYTRPHTQAPSPELRQVSPGKTASGEATDPSCGMKVDNVKATAAGYTTAYRGTIYYFCSRECRDKFDKNPEKYVSSQLHGGQP